MCNHVYSYPEDNPLNYNSDGRTLTGVCKCGSKKESYGMRWVIRIEEKFMKDDPYGELHFNYLTKEKQRGITG